MNSDDPRDTTANLDPRELIHRTPLETTRPRPRTVRARIRLRRGLRPQQPTWRPRAESSRMAGRGHAGGAGFSGRNQNAPARRDECWCQRTRIARGNPLYHSLLGISQGNQRNASFKRIPARARSKISLKRQARAIQARAGRSPRAPPTPEPA
jgi:hypothetical protein